VRQTPSRELHAILGKFDRTRRAADLTERQEWLWDQAVAELEHRRRTCRPMWLACSCKYCVPPF